MDDAVHPTALQWVGWRVSRCFGVGVAQECVPADDDSRGRMTGQATAVRRRRAGLAPGATRAVPLRVWGVQRRTVGERRRATIPLTGGRATPALGRGTRPASRNLCDLNLPRLTLLCVGIGGCRPAPTPPACAAVPLRIGFHATSWRGLSRVRPRGRSGPPPRWSRPPGAGRRRAGRGHGAVARTWRLRFVS